jgi:hypothetical protein
MKYLLIATALAFITCCKKTDSLDAELAKLPPITQTGANTFGFLLNGQPWVPAGNNGSGNNLSIDYDPMFNNGILGIAAYNAIAISNGTQYAGIGISDSLNFVTGSKVYNLTNTSLYRARITKDPLCMLLSVDARVKCEGKLYLDVYDKTKKFF